MRDTSEISVDISFSSTGRWTVRDTRNKINVVKPEMLIFKELREELGEIDQWSIR